MVFIKSHSSKNIKTAAEIIKSGGVVVFPTETVYGLGVNAFDAAACRKIFKIKNRPRKNPLIVHISDLKMLDQIAENVPATAKTLIENFWPGPLTIIFKKKTAGPERRRGEVIADIVSAGLKTVAVRMPSNKIALNLIKAAGVPIAAPSANVSGYVSPTHESHVSDDYSNESSLKMIDMILCGGQTKHGIESTIIDVSKQQPAILRQGFITLEKIENVLKQKVLWGGVKHKKILSPGMYKRHYSPKTPLYVFDNINNIVEFISKHKDKKIGILINVKHLKALKIFKKRNIYTMTYKNLNELSRKLYSCLRAFDSDGNDFIVAQKVADRFLGRAINDRLCRAGSVL